MNFKILFLSLFLTQILSAQTFTEVTFDPELDGILYSSIAFSDVDGDSDPDVLITGVTDLNQRISKLYTNDGQGNFIELLGTPFDGVWIGSIAFSDVDGDEDPDVLITGDRSQEDLISKLYKNDGQGNFTELSGTSFDGVDNGSIAFTDVDGDNDPDVLITGRNSSSERITKLYLNDGIETSTDDILLGSNFELQPYPNPAAANTIKVDLPAGQVDFNSTQNGFVTVEVYDLNGQLLSQQKEFTIVGQQTILLNIDGLSAGNYFIQLDDGKKIGVGKFIIP